MPVRSSIGSSAPAAATPAYPKLMRARVSGNVWLVTGPKTGVVVFVGDNARNAKAPGYTSSKLSEAKMTPFVGNVVLSA